MSEVTAEQALEALDTLGDAARVVQGSAVREPKTLLQRFIIQQSQAARTVSDMLSEVQGRARA